MLPNCSEAQSLMEEVDSRQGFSRPSNKGNNNNQPRNGISPSPSPVSAQAGPGPGSRPPPLASPPASTSNSSLNDFIPSGDSTSYQTYTMPFFLHDQLQLFLVKGNYMTLAVKPKAVELGEWIAHQVVEQYQTLTKFVALVQASEPGKPPLCNLQSCPTMSAGGHTYTWLDINKNPTRLPAYRYIELVQRWITGKITDTNLFPTDSTSAAAPATYASGGLNTPGATTPIPAGPTSLDLPLTTLAGPDWIGKSSGFPENFFENCRNIFKQMFRIYAHMYWHHFEWPFYHLDMERWLNSSFMLFVIVGTELELLTLKDLDPMQPLLEKWCAMEKFPADCRYLTMVSATSNNSSQQTPSSATSTSAPSQTATTLDPTASNTNTPTLTSASGTSSMGSIPTPSSASSAGPSAPPSAS